MKTGFAVRDGDHEQSNDQAARYIQKGEKSAEIILLNVKICMEKDILIESEVHIQFFLLILLLRLCVIIFKLCSDFL